MIPLAPPPAHEPEVAEQLGLPASQDDAVARVKEVVLGALRTALRMGGPADLREMLEEWSRTLARY